MKATISIETRDIVINDVTGTMTAIIDFGQYYKGDKGNSAYEDAVEKGYVGTLEQWLASLKGEKGEQGEKGDKGDKGDDGDFGLVATEIDANGHLIIHSTSDVLDFDIIDKHLVIRV